MTECNLLESPVGQIFFKKKEIGSKTIFLNMVGAYRQCEKSETISTIELDLSGIFSDKKQYEKTLKKQLEFLMGKLVVLQDKDNETILNFSTPISSVKLDIKSWIGRFEITSQIDDFLHTLSLYSDEFLSDFFSLNTAYSRKVFYSIFIDKNVTEIKLESLQSFLGVPKTLERYSNFRQKILIPTLKEIAQSTDKYLIFKTIKENGVTKKISFETVSDSIEFEHFLSSQSCDRKNNAEAEELNSNIGSNNADSGVANSNKITSEDIFESAVKFAELKAGSPQKKFGYDVCSEDILSFETREKSIDEMSLSPQKITTFLSKLGTDTKAIDYSADSTDNDKNISAAELTLSSISNDDIQKMKVCSNFENEFCQGGGQDAILCKKCSLFKTNFLFPSETPTSVKP